MDSLKQFEKAHQASKSCIGHLLGYIDGASPGEAYFREFNADEPLT